MFDSCVHIKQSNLDYLIKISNKIKSYNIKKALCMFDNEKNKKDKEIFYNNCLKTKNLTPVALIKNSKNLKNEIKSIVNIGFNYIKFHPRNLNLKIGSNFYIKEFKMISFFFKFMCLKLS